MEYVDIVLVHTARYIVLYYMVIFSSNFNSEYDSNFLRVSFKKFYYPKSMVPQNYALKDGYVKALGFEDIYWGF